MGGVGGPGPGLRLPPFAHAKHDRPAGGVQGVAHLGVTLFRIGAVGVAPVVFQIVDAPRGIRLGVLLLVFVSAGKARAGLCARAVVHAEFETLRVEVVAEGLHAARELLGIGHEIAVGIALSGAPAVVDHDVLIAGVPHAILGHRVGHAADEFFIDVAGERVPTVPAHRRSLGEAVELLGRRGTQCDQANHASKPPPDHRLEPHCSNEISRSLAATPPESLSIVAALARRRPVFEQSRLGAPAASTFFDSLHFSPNGTHGQRTSRVGNSRPRIVVNPKHARANDSIVPSHLSHHRPRLR